MFPFPQPLTTTILLSVFMNLILQATRTREIIQYLSFCDWLILLSIMFFVFNHVIAGVRISFLFKAE